MLEVLHNLPIKAKFLAVSFVLFVCFTGLGVSAYLTLTGSARDLDRLSNVNLTHQLTISDLNHDVLFAHSKVARYATWSGNGTNKRLLDPLRIEIALEFAAMSKRIRAFADRADLRPAERTMASIAVGLWAKYAQSAQDTVDVSSVDGLLASTMLSAADDNFQDLADNLQTISFLIAGNTQDASRDLAKRADTNARILAIGALLTLVIGVLVTLFVSGSVVNPIRSVTRAMASVSTGNASIAGHERRKDEIGQMMRAVMAFRRTLEQKNRLLHSIIANFPGGISLLDNDLRVVVSNDTLRKLLAFPDTLFDNGPPLLEDLFRFNAARGEYGLGDPEGQVATRMALARARQAHVFERARPDGTVVEIRGVPLDDGGFVTSYTDITERRRMEAKVAHMARHDALTDLPNRVLLQERLEQALTRVSKGELLAVLCLDLDYFKTVNDTLGHALGDALLAAVAERLRACVRQSDTVARIGGDEFAILQVATEEVAGAAALAQRIIEAVSAPYNLGEHQITSAISIGVAIAPNDGVDPDQLLRNADLALYRAKSDGRGTYRFFEPEMDARMRARRALELDLRKALINGEFELYYQPFVNIRRNEVCGFEALLRWHHPERGMVSPVEFIPVAEETGLIVSIGEWVTRTACAEAATWPEHFTVAVNLSPVQFQSKTLVEMVFNALSASGLPGRRLELEITESALLQNSVAIRATVDQLRALGVRIAMDDFGTGYSSLGYLQSFPFDKIKIDRSFISNLSNGTGALAIVKAIISLANSLGVPTIAEGVETQEQLDKVRAEGCGEIQGFLFSPARPAAEITRLFLPTPEMVDSAA